MRIKVQRTSIDRPELLLRTGFIPRNTRSAYSALRYLFDGASLSTIEKVIPKHIPKTIVFFDSKREAHQAHDECRSYLKKSQRHRYSEQQALEIVQVFTRDTHDEDKESIIKDLQRPDDDSSVRVVLATEALGLGVNITSILRVVLYGLIKGGEIAVMWQRGGRAARNGQDGEIVILVDEWVIGDRLVHSSGQKASIPTGELDDITQDADQEEDGGKEPSNRKKRSRTDPERRGMLPEFWYQLFNNQDCIRRRILDYFQEPAEYRGAIREHRCCSNCNPEYKLGLMDKHYMHHELGNRLTKARKEIDEDIGSWAEARYRAVYDGTFFRSQPVCFLSKGQRIQLSKDAHEILNIDHLRMAIGPWDHIDAYGEELLKAVRQSYYDTRERASTKRSSQSQTTPLASSTGRKRLALEPVSGNVRKRVRRGNTTASKKI